MTRPASAWRLARNAAARARLDRALPDRFPAPVLVHALARTWIPALPRLAVESYWAAHPLRADRLARALAAKSGAPQGWARHLSRVEADGLPRSVRVPPAPYREAAGHLGPGRCCLCGQPVFRFGWHADLCGEGTTNRRARWHACCVAAWRFWLAPHRSLPLLARMQKRRCARTGERLLRSAEVDHVVPLSEVWRERRHRPWPEQLAFWGMPNLRVVNRDAHAEKSAAEAATRAAARAASARPALLRGAESESPRVGLPGRSPL